MYHHQHTFSTHYASISPKAKLKVHVFLNVGHQWGCTSKAVTSGTSVKIFFFLPTCLRSLLIYCTALTLRGWTDGIFSDIMNLKDCAVGLSDSLVLPQQVKTRSGVWLSRPWWRRNWGKLTLALWSPDWTATGERDCRRMRTGGGAAAPPVGERCFQ